MNFLIPLLEVLIPALIAPWIVRRLRKPTDFQRSQIIKTLAESIATQILKEHPTAQWAQLVKLIVDRLSANIPAGYGTTNLSVLERAAQDALAARGVK